MPEPKLAGTPLSPEDFKKGGVFTVRDVPRMEYAWDAGRAIGGYLEGLKEGKLMARRCRGCRRILLPPRMQCERCWRPTDGWVEVAALGSVNTFSLCTITWDMVPLKKPQIPAVIDVEGTSGGILHLLGEVDPKKVKIGMKVEAVWRPARQRTGAITDIRHWRPR
jgi:uncharacterized OB-fold protein